MNLYENWIKDRIQKCQPPLTRTQSEFAKWLIDNHFKISQIGDLVSIFKSVHDFLKYKP